MRISFVFPFDFPLYFPFAIPSSRRRGAASCMRKDLRKSVGRGQENGHVRKTHRRFSSSSTAAAIVLRAACSGTV